MVVHAQIRLISDQTPDFNNGTIELKENLEWLLIGEKNWKMNRMTRYIITGEIINHKLSQNRFMWFVKQ
ncbi:MAG: hypothetical protein AAGA64_04785 [Bacteroidota bacterium]